MQEKEELEYQLREQIDFKKLNELCEYLTDAVREIFQSCGLYFRIFSRVKSVESIARKLLHGQYGTQANPKNLQDLIGLRVVLYYYDDLSICRDIMESTFQMVDSWSKTNYNADEFKAAKINGVFKIPAEYFRSYTRSIWTLPIDTTFEIQFRTVFFEGWHEIEHDMRYKSLLSDAQFWQGSEELSRILNCILANLELSDWSLVQLFDQLSYNHYKNGNWELMLKSKFRIKMDDSIPLDHRILSIFDQNREVAKQFFKCSRHSLIRELLKQDSTHVTHNLIIQILNDTSVHNEEIGRVCRQLASPQAEHSFQKPSLSPLDSYTLFHIDIPLLHRASRDMHNEFLTAANILYKWAKHKMNAVFPDLPADISSYHGQLPGYSLDIRFQPGQPSFEIQLCYIDTQHIGTLWQMDSSIKRRGDLLQLRHVTSYSIPRGTIHKETFCKPSFLADLSNKIGLLDGIRLSAKAHFVSKQTDFDGLLRLLEHPQRQLPIVVLLQHAPSASQEDKWDGYDMNTFSVNGTRLAKVTGLYSHIFMISHRFLGQWVKAQNLSPSEADGCIMIFWPGSPEKKVELFTQEMVFETHFDFNRFAFHDETICEKAFRHKLVQLLKNYNCSSLSQGDF